MIKEKSWLWWLTVFANPNVITTIKPHIYVPKYFNELPKKQRDQLMKHENIHLKQQEEVGLLKYLFLYIFCLPLVYNPWRYKWEYEAYTKSGCSKREAKQWLSSWHYGWLKSK